MRALLMIVGSAALLGIATSASSQNAPDTPLVRKKFVLDGVALAVSLPAANAAKASVHGRRIIIDFARNMRLQRMMTLSVDGLPAEGPVGPRRALPGGRWFSYRIEDDIGGGSGGPIAQLSGILELGSIEITVTCTDQHEWSRDPEWCLPYVSHVELDRGL
jgi:hypothetical protein